MRKLTANQVFVYSICFTCRSIGLWQVKKDKRVYEFDSEDVGETQKWLVFFSNCQNALGPFNVTGVMDEAVVKSKEYKSIAALWDKNFVQARSQLSMLLLFLYQMYDY